MAVEKLTFEMNAVGNAVPQMQQVQKQLTAVNSRLQVASSSMAVAGRSSARMGSQVQNAAFQVGDFAVQVAAGTSATRAMAMQLPQLLGGFGVWGALAGAAVAVGSALLLARKNTDDLTSSSLSLSQVTSDLNSTMDIATMSAKKMAEMYGEGAARVRDAAVALLELRSAQAGARLRDMAVASKDVIEQFSLFGSVGETLSPAMNQMMQDLNMTWEQAEQLQRVFGEIYSSDLSSAAEVFGKLDNTLRDAGITAEGLPFQLRSALIEFGSMTMEAEELKAAMERADSTVEQFSLGASIAIPEAAKRASEALTEMQERTKSIADTMQSAMTSGFMSIIDGTKSAKDAFRDMARSIIAKLYEVLVVQRLVGSFDAATGTGTGLVGMIMGAFGGFRANGGPVSGGTPYIVGERGPELFVPSRSGTIVPNGAGGGVTVIQNNTFGNGVSRAEIQSMLPRIVETTKAAVFDAQRRSVNGLGYA